MKNIYTNHLLQAENVSNNNERLSYLTSILRSVLHLAVVSTFEIVNKKTPSDETGLVELTSRFCKPVDGLAIQIIDELTPILRGYYDEKYLQGWFETIKDIDESLSKQLVKWVGFRNSRPAHGVLDEKLEIEWSKKTENIIKACLIVFSEIIPKRVGDDVLELSKRYNNFRLETPVVHKEHAIVIMRIIDKKGIWKLKGQVLSRVNAEEFTVELATENIFNVDGIKPKQKYDLAEVLSNNECSTFFHNIPVRQTDIFEGRFSEITKLKEWFDDEDSRYCLIYGDGGYGKTTLVLEMLNRLIENQYDFDNPLPTIISYHTAKMTRWNEEGLTHLTAISPQVDECLRDLVRFFEPVLTQDWYAVSGAPLIDKTKGVLSSHELSRDDVLLVIDNTETLATDAHQVQELGSFFKLIGKSIGRIIITSRRREFIEATPIIVEGLSEIESVSLMQRLAEEFHAKSILQAGESTLRKVSNQLMRKPILLETLVKYIARANVGIEAAVDSVFRKSSEELLEFLYEDAWARMNHLQKEVFMTLIHIYSPIDQNTIGKACQELGIQNSEFQTSLDETHFYTLLDSERIYSIELVELARRFFESQFSKLHLSDKDRLKSIATSVDLYAAEREKIEREYKNDRVAEAFRSDYAKAAKIAADKGDIEDAISFYKIAIEEDPVNSSLHDRFSWFLLNKANDYEYAKKISEKSVELDESNCDAVVGLALVNYRLGNIEDGDKCIDRAQKLGRSLSFCLLRKAISRYYKSKKEHDIDSKLSLIEDAFEQLSIAEKRNSRNGGYDAKNLKGIKRYREIVRRELTNLRTKKTKSANQNI